MGMEASSVSVSKADIARLCQLFKESQMQFDFERLAREKAMEPKPPTSERAQVLKEQARKLIEERKTS